MRRIGASGVRVPVGPGRRQRRDRQAVVYSVGVERAVADRAYDFTFDVTADAGDGARLPSGIVSRPVLTVTPWVAGVAHLGDLVIPDLGVGRVYHAETTAVHIEARTDTTQDVYFECRQGEARRVAARAPDASGIRLAPQDPRARRVWVPACDAGRMAAAGGRVFRRHRKHGLDGSRREGERL